MELMIKYNRLYKVTPRSLRQTLRSSQREHSAFKSVLHLMFVLLMVGCSESQQADTQSTESATSETKIQRVQVVHPSSNSFNSEILISGTAHPDKMVMIHAMENGMVKSILKDIGDRVKKGETLARLANPELQRMQQGYAAEVAGKKATFERLEQSYQASSAITPAQLVEDARAAYLSSQARLDAANDRLSFLTIRAPFSGTITKRLVDPGAVVQSGITSSTAGALFEIQNLDVIRLSVPLPERDAGFVSKGMEVEVTFPELPGEIYTVPVSRSSNALDMASRTMAVEIDIDNSDGRLKPGMYAKVRMQLNSRSEVLSLPVTAQVIYQDEPCVLVVTDGIVARMPIRKGLTNKDFFEVINPELDNTSQVIVQGKSLVKPGDKAEAVLKVK